MSELVGDCLGMVRVFFVKIWVLYRVVLDFPKGTQSPI